MYRVDNFISDSPFELNQRIVNFLNLHSVGINNIVNLNIQDDYAVLIWYDNSEDEYI